MAFATVVKCSRCREPIGDNASVELVYDDLGRIDGIRHRDCPVRYPSLVT
jgi:hypothetical protein